MALSESEYTSYDALGLAELVRHGEVTPGELLDAAIARIERHNPALNAVIHRMDDYARRQIDQPGNAGHLADGAFKGVPILLKDLGFALAGQPLRQGSRYFHDFVPSADSEQMTRLKATGALFAGRTNTPEFGLVPYTEPETFGPTHNPWNLTRSPGGSSGGSAAAVAARLVPLATASDGGGSIRIPSSCCGVFGLKPTRGRNPTGPFAGEYWEGLAVEHAITRSVRDSAALLDATCGPDPGAPYYAPPCARPYLAAVTTDPGSLRIASTAEPLLGGSVHPACIAGLESTVALLRDLGHEVIEAAPAVDARLVKASFMAMASGQTRAYVEEMALITGRKPRRQDFELQTWLAFLLGRAMSADAYIQAMDYLHLTTRTVGQFYAANNIDVLLTPVLSQPPVPIGYGQLDGIKGSLLSLVGRLRAVALLKFVDLVEEMSRLVFDYITFTPLFNITGQPAMSVPLHWSADGLPIGMQFVGRYAGEATLFRLAGQLERACPWSDRMPPGFTSA